MRRKSGGYWTVRYTDGNGMYYDVNHFATRKEALEDIILNTEDYPLGEGKIVYVRS